MMNFGEPHRFVPMFEHPSGVDSKNRISFLKTKKFSFPIFLPTLCSWIAWALGVGGELLRKKTHDLNEDASNISLLNTKISGRLSLSRDFNLMFLLFLIC